MNSIRITSTRCAFVLAAALLSFAALIGPLEASAKKKGPPVGVWAGDATYTSPPEADGSGGGIEYDSGIVITTGRNNGAVRVTGVVATVRTYCLSGVRDIRILKSNFKNGPKVSAAGHFTFKAQGATIRGRLGRPSADGTIRAAAAGCELSDGRWEATKQRF
jgi:hypothetical protein